MIGLTALHAAVKSQHGHVDVVSLLLLDCLLVASQKAAQFGHLFAAPAVCMAVFDQL